ncbi:YkvA family protein [Hymenobacter terrenus]|uniref:YkvA family protein n=1 Tax=Hymenobacter terrenus TaxID=1629124 RepID=UPI0006975578|nr:YkvA family protein [Hymenobacter terrenus]
MSTLTEKGLRLSKNALFNVFIGRATKLLGRPFKVVTILNEVADKLADKENKTNKFRQLFEVALTMVRLVRSYVSGEYRQISTGTIVSGLAVLLYVLSPVDLVPDFIPVLGFLDDLSLISWFIGKFQSEISRFREWEERGHGQSASARRIEAEPDTAAKPALGDVTQPSVAELGHS